MQQTPQRFELLVIIVMSENVFLTFNVKHIQFHDTIVKKITLFVSFARRVFLINEQ